MKWNWRWMIGDYVPRESGLRRTERRSITKQAMKASVGSVIPAVYGGCCGVIFASTLTMGRNIASLPIVFLYVMLLALFLNYMMGFWFARRSWPAIHQELNRRGIELCWECNYQLKGLGPEITRCPECGEPLARHQASLQETERL